MDFKKSFCCSFNLSNDDIISVLCKHVMLHFVTNSRFENEYGFQRPGLKTGVENDIFWSEMRVRIWRTGRQSPTVRIPRSTPPPLPDLLQLTYCSQSQTNRQVLRIQSTKQPVFEEGASDQTRGRKPSVDRANKGLRETAHLPLLEANINTSFILRAKCQLGRWVLTVFNPILPTGRYKA